MPLPGWLCPWVEQRFGLSGLTGYEPNALGYVETRKTDLTTLKDTYADSDLTTPNANPFQLDADGRPTSPMYLANDEAYSFYVYDVDMVLLYSVDYVSSAYLFAAIAGKIATEGTVATSSPYTVQSTDNLIIVDSATTPFVIVLPAAVDRGLPLLIKTISPGVTVRVTPTSPEAIDSISAYVELGPFTAPPAPAMGLLSDGVSAWWISSYWNG